MVLGWLDCPARIQYYRSMSPIKIEFEGKTILDLKSRKQTLYDWNANGEKVLIQPTEEGFETLTDMYEAGDILALRGNRFAVAYKGKLLKGTTE